VTDESAQLSDTAVVIVAGGAGRRLGGFSKPDLEVGGVNLLDITLSAVEGASAVVIVGGPRRDGALWTVENPPGSGPAAAVGAGVLALADAGSVAPWTFVLAVDTPRVARALLPLLAARRDDGAWMVDADGREQPLLAVYRTESLAARTGTPLAGVSMRTLVQGLAMVAVPDVHGDSRDIDTWDDARHFKEQGND